MSLATFAALDVVKPGGTGGTGDGGDETEEGGRRCPVTRDTFNCFLPWLPASASSRDRAVFRLLSAGRVLDTVTTMAIIGAEEGAATGLSCFPAMHGAQTKIVDAFFADLV